MKKIILTLAALLLLIPMGAAVADDERPTITVTWRLAEGSTIDAPFAGGPQTLVVGEVDQCEAAVYQQDVYWAGPEIDAVMADGLLQHKEDWGLLAHEATAPDKPWSFFSLVPNTELCEPPVEPPVVEEPPAPPAEEEPPPTVTVVNPPRERVYDGYDVPAGELG